MSYDDEIVAVFRAEVSEQFEALANPGNCAIVTIGPRGAIADSTHESGRWAVSGLRLR